MARPSISRSGGHDPAVAHGRARQGREAGLRLRRRGRGERGALSLDADEDRRRRRQRARAIRRYRLSGPPGDEPPALGRPGRARRERGLGPVRRGPRGHLPLDRRGGPRQDGLRPGEARGHPLLPARRRGAVAHGRPRQRQGGAHPRWRGRRVRDDVPVDIVPGGLLLRVLSPPRRVRSREEADGERDEPARAQPGGGALPGRQHPARGGRIRHAPARHVPRHRLLDDGLRRRRRPSPRDGEDQGVGLRRLLAGCGTTPRA